MYTIGWARDIFLLVLGLWVAAIVGRSLRSGTTISIYGPALSTYRKNEPGAFWLEIGLRGLVAAGMLGLGAWGFVEKLAA